jgi:hypothetical protein
MTLLQRRRQRQLRLDWTFGHAPIVCGLDPRAFPLELAPNPLGCCCCCIGGSCHSAELQNFRTVFFSKNTRALVGNFARMLTEFKSSAEKQMLGPQSGEISWPRMQKTSKLKNSYFQLKKDEEEGEEAEAKRFAATHQIRIDPPAANKLLLLFFTQTLQSETLLLLLLLIVYSWCRRNNNSWELHLESATVKKEPWKKTTLLLL